VEAGGSATAVQVDKVEGGVTVTLPTYGTPARAPRLHVPPAARGRFFGREELLAEVTAAVLQRQPTLLYGVGGIGKTALAAAAAQRLHAERAFGGGALWVSEVGQAPLAAVCDAIARQLGDEEIPRLPPPAKPDAVRDLLADRSDLLLVLDHLRDYRTARSFVEDCLPAKVALLATSRSRHTAFEADFRVGRLSRAEAAQLFRDRARLDLDGALVEEICALLDDHPLALVIAAGRVRTEGIPAASLRGRLADERRRLAALDIGDGGDRSQSVRLSLQLSYDDLPPAPQRAFTALAACFGPTTGITRLAELLDVPAADCEDLVGRLAAQSLAEREGGRISLLRLLRDFGLHALGDGRLAVRDRLVEVMRQHAERHRQPTPENYDQLEEELANLLGALRYAAERPLWPAALALAHVLARPVSGALGVRGYWGELIAAGKLGVEAAQQACAPEDQAELAVCVAISLHRRGEYGEARRYYQMALDISRQRQDQETISQALHNLGMLAQSQGQYAEAHDLYQQSLTIKRDQLQDKVGMARTLHELGRLAGNRGNYAEAQSFFDQSLALKRELGDEVGVAVTLWNKGRTYAEQGEYEEARRLHEESLRIATRRGDRQGIALARYHLGRIAHAQGDYAGSRAAYQESLATFRALRAQANAAGMLHDLGRLALRQGDYAEARARYEDSQAMRQAVGDRAGVADGLHQLGLLLAAEGNRGEARRLLEESLATFEQLPDQAGVARAWHELGRLALEEGDVRRAEQLLRQSLELSERIGARGEVARNLRQQARLAEKSGEAAEAERLRREALRLFEQLGWPEAAALRNSPTPPAG
jgi:tetratricopeptide (TPR) repeat protein